MIGRDVLGGGGLGGSGRRQWLVAWWQEGRRQWQGGRLVAVASKAVAGRQEAVAVASCSGWWQKQF